MPKPVPAPVPQHRQAAFTLVEAAIVVAILAVLASLAIPAYGGYMDRATLAQARTDIAAIDQQIARYEIAHNGALPETLAEIGGAPRDPWGRPYQYLNLRNPANLNQARKDHNLHPINTDYDLYSMGKDGQSVKPLTGAPSRDDIIRGRNGRFVGKAVDF